MIGQGAYGIVYKGRKEDTGEVVAIKRIPFADSTPEGGVPCNVIREISLLRELDHPNVVRCAEGLLPNCCLLLGKFPPHSPTLFFPFGTGRSNCLTSSKHTREAYTWSLNTSHTILKRTWTNFKPRTTFLNVLACHYRRSAPSSDRSLPAWDVVTPTAFCTGI